MKPAFVMLTAGVLCALAACGPAPAPDGVEALAADPARLKALRAQCQTDRAKAGEAACQAAAEAFRRRFLAGTAGPDEYTSPAELPPIPPTFDEPATDEPTVDEPDAPPAEVLP